MGVKLLVFGGCLELGRYGGLTLTEANSILFDAIKVIDGEKADLEEFYEAKQTYSDNKIAIYLTGIGAYLMHQIITDQKLYTKALNQAFDKWEAQRNPEVHNRQVEVNRPKETAEEEISEPTINIEKAFVCRANIKSDLKFMDASIPNQDDIANNISGTIRSIIANLVEKYHGHGVVEAGGVTSIDFDKIRDAVKFTMEYLKDIASFIEENNDDRMILRNCCALTKANDNIESGFDQYVLSIFEHIYNNEIVTIKDIAMILEGDGYEFDYLGEKLLKEINTNAELYKLKY